MKPTNVPSALRPSSIAEVVYLGGDQPKTCGWCGMRTMFDELSERIQRHECPKCKACYLVEFD